jgi:HSP20 family protein
MATLEKWTPLRELDLMERRMRRLFEGFGVVPALVPAADIYESDREVVVELDVPGFAEKELEIEISDHTLCVKGARKEETEKKENTLRLRERLEREFERRFELPAAADMDHVRATYANGVLTLHVPKAKDAEPHKVEINA